MRKFWILVTRAVVGTVVMASFIGVAPAGASTSKKASKPVQVDGKVTVKGTKDISFEEVREHRRRGRRLLLRAHVREGAAG